MNKFRRKKNIRIQPKKQKKIKKQNTYADTCELNSS